MELKDKDYLQLLRWHVWQPPGQMWHSGEQEIKAFMRQVTLHPSIALHTFAILKSIRNSNEGQLLLVLLCAMEANHLALTRPISKQLVF